MSSEYYYVKITIPVSALSDPDISEEIDALRLMVRTKSEKTITFFDNECEDTGFEDLEYLLQSKGIPFDRYARGDEFVTDYWRCYRPARDGKPEIDIETPLTVDGVPYIEACKLLPLLDMEPHDALEELRSIIFKTDPGLDPYVGDIENWI